MSVKIHETMSVAQFQGFILDGILEKKLYEKYATPWPIPDENNRRLFGSLQILFQRKKLMSLRSWTNMGK